MTNLNDKFDALETQLAAQNSAMLLALADLGLKLDAIAGALGAPPPAQSVTLATVNDTLTALVAVASNIHLDTQSIDLKALSIRNEVRDMHLDTQSIDLKLLRLRDAIAPLDELMPSESRSSVLWSLYRIMDAINPVWPRPASIPAQPALDLIFDQLNLIKSDVDDMQHAIGLVQGDATSTVLGRLGAIEGATSNIADSTGLLPAPATNTQLDLLKKIRALSGCGCSNGEPPIGDCSEPFDSRGMWLGPFGALGGTSVIVATWDGILPAGLTYGNVFGIAEDQTELICSDWSQWQVYVGSSEGQYSDSPTSLSRYPTNQWRLLDGSGSRAFSVSERGSILVTLCPVASFHEGGDGGDDGGDPVGQGCEATAAVLAHHSVLGANVTSNIGNMQGGFYWFNGNDVDSGQLEISVDGVVKKTIRLTPNYDLQSLGFIGSGSWTLRHIGAGNQDVYLSRCPDVQS